MFPTLLFLVHLPSNIFLSSYKFATGYSASIYTWRQNLKKWRVDPWAIVCPCWEVGTSPFHQNPESVLSSSRRIPLRPPFSSSEGRSKLCVSGKSPSTLHSPPSTLHQLHYSTPSFDDAPLRRRRRSATPHSSTSASLPDPTKWGSIINQGRKFDEQRIRRQVKKLLKYERTPSTEWAALVQTWKKILFRNGKLIYNFFIFWRTSQKRHCNFLCIVWLSSILSRGSWDREFW